MSFADLVELVDRSVQKTLGGESVIYDPAGAGGPVTITGVFDERYVLTTDERGEPAAETVRPVVFVRLEDLPADSPPDPLDISNPTNPPTPLPLVTIRSLNYRVLWRQTDGIGAVMLVLMRTA